MNSIIDHIPTNEPPHHENNWRLSKNIDVGTLISLATVLYVLFVLSNKFENRMTAVETKVQILMMQMRRSQ